MFKRRSALGEALRFAVFWTVSMLLTAALVGLALAVSMIVHDFNIQPKVDLVFVLRVVWAGVLFGLWPLVVLWLPGWFVFELVAALLERLGRQTAATISAGSLALFVAGSGSLVFRGLFYFSGFVGLVVGPTVAWWVWRNSHQPLVGR